MMGSDDVAAERFGVDAVDYLTFELSFFFLVSVEFQFLIFVIEHTEQSSYE